MLLLMFRAAYLSFHARAQPPRHVFSALRHHPSLLSFFFTSPIIFTHLNPYSPLLQKRHSTKAPFYKSAIPQTNNNRNHPYTSAVVVGAAVVCCAVILAGVISEFVCCATILAFQVALAWDLYNQSQEHTAPASNGHFGQAVSLDKTVGGEPKRGAALTERHRRQGYEALAGQPRSAIIASGRGLMARGLIWL